MNFIIHQGAGANYYIRSAWVNALRVAGHNVYYWDDTGKSAFDAFAEFTPEVFIGSTWQLNKALVKNLIKRPQVKVLLCADIWGSLEIDQNKYPVGVADDNQKRLAEELVSGGANFHHVITQHSQKSADITHNRWTTLGLKVTGLPLSADVTEYFPANTEELYKTDLTYCGGKWAYKSQVIDKYLSPLFYPATKWKIKVFGSGWNCVHFLGNVSSTSMCKFYRNAGVIPSFGESHSYDIYSDIPQRYTQVPASMGFQIAPRLLGIDELFNDDEIVLTDSPKEFFDKVVYYLNKPEETEPYRRKSCLRVFRDHTNFHRSANLMRLLGEDDAANKLLQIVYNNYDRVEKMLNDWSREKNN